MSRFLFAAHQFDGIIRCKNQASTKDITLSIAQEMKHVSQQYSIICQSIRLRELKTKQSQQLPQNTDTNYCRPVPMV
jgi:hypothetical protein